jgi:hypothetical protein
MADIPPINPGASGGAVQPPMKKSTGRVQPKKETVRINLPPKPTAAPTIKLPTLPPGGPTGASGGIPLPSAAAAPRPAAAAPRSAAAPVAQARPAAPTAQRAVSAAAPTVGVFDKILAIAACVTALAAVGTTVWMMMILNAALK